MAKEEKLRKKPSTSLGGTSIENNTENRVNYPKGKPPAYPYVERKNEKIARVKKRIEKMKPQIKPKQIHENKHTVPHKQHNILSIIAIILSILAIFLVLTSSGIDKTELKGIASDLRALNNKQVSITVPIKSDLYFNNAIPSNQLFKGSQIVPVYFEIPINQTMKGKDIRTGIPVEVQIQENVIVQGDIIIDLSTSNISLELNEPAKAVGNTTSIVTVKDVYGMEISSIADRLDKLSE